jgi:hypothetical protein
MGLFDRPADAGCLAALRCKPIPDLTEALAGLADDDWEGCLNGLEAARLLTVNRDTAGALVSLDAHPHIREYFAKQVREGPFGSHFLRKLLHFAFPRVAITTRAWRAAHGRLYDHLCASTPDKPQPTLEDLQPLYQAVAHGCQADRQQEVILKVYWPRIQRGLDGYGQRRLGAFGEELAALSAFFVTPWSILLGEKNLLLPSILNDTTIGFSEILANEAVYSDFTYLYELKSQTKIFSAEPSGTYKIYVESYYKEVANPYYQAEIKVSTGAIDEDRYLVVGTVVWNHDTLTLSDLIDLREDKFGHVWRHADSSITHRKIMLGVMHDQRRNCYLPR